LFLLTKKKNLGLAGTYVANKLEGEEKASVIKRLGLASVILIILIILSIQFGWLTINSFISLVGILGFLIPTAYFIVMYRSPKTTDVERSRILAFIPLFVASVMFWSIQEQGSTILARFADQRTQLEFLGITLSPAWFQSLNPLFIITLAPVFAWLWMKLGNK